MFIIDDLIYMVNNKDIIYTIVWNELVHAKYWEQTISKYSSVKKFWRNCVSAIILILSTMGAATYPIWSLSPGSELITFILLVLISIGQLIMSITPFITLDDEALLSLSRLRCMYISYFNKIERLFLDIYECRISKKEAEEKYYKIRECVYPIEKLKDSINIKYLKRVDKHAMKETMKYLERTYDISK